MEGQNWCLLKLVPGILTQACYLSTSRISESALTETVSGEGWSGCNSPLLHRQGEKGQEQREPGSDCRRPPGLLLWASSLHSMALPFVQLWGVVLLEPGSPCLHFPSSVNLMLVASGNKGSGPGFTSKGHLGPSVNPCEDPAPSRTQGPGFRPPGLIPGGGSTCTRSQSFEVVVPLLWEVSHTLVRASGPAGAEHSFLHGTPDHVLAWPVQEVQGHLAALLPDLPPSSDLENHLALGFDTRPDKVGHLARACS